MTFNFFAVVWLFYMLAFPVRLDVIHNEPFPVYPKELKRGEQINWEVEFTKTNDFPATINRTIVCQDGGVFLLAPEETNAPQGDRSVAKGGVVLPQNVSSGKCHVEFGATYHINPIRDIQRSYKTQTFNVIE